MAKRKKRSPIQQEYYKERRRIQRAIKRIEARGYIAEYELPKEPKKITRASIRRLKRIKPEDIYKKSVKLNQETGEIIPGLEARRAERKAAARKAAETRREQKRYKSAPSESEMVLYNFRNKLREFAGAELTHIISDWFEKLVRDYGEEAAAKTIQAGEMDGYILDWAVCYNTKIMASYLSAMIDRVPEITQFGKDDFFKVLEEYEEWWQG